MCERIESIPVNVMERTVCLSTTGYDPFITFMKGYAILCVLLAHAIPNPDATGYVFWGGMQVPLFLLIQTFHSFKKKPKFSLTKILKRVVLPFLLAQACVIAMVCRDGDVSNQLKISVIGGGRGPGAYYFWIYLQFAILLPFVYPLLSKLKKSSLLILFLLVSEGCEVLSSVIAIPEPVYRLLCLRYLFLIYLGYEWVRQGIVINWKTLLLSVISIVTIVYFTYLDGSLEPVFFDTSWRYHRWICYFFVAYLFAYLISLFFVVVSKVNLLDNFFKILGESSWEIYVVQMAVFALFSKSLLSFLPASIITITWMFVTIALSIIFGILYHRFWIKYVIK